MWRRRCGCRRNGRAPMGPLLIAIGVGVLLAYIMPYYMLIIMFGVALVAMGIWFVCKK